MTQTIDSRTKIGLFVVIGTVPLIATTVFFVSMIYFKADSAEAQSRLTENRLDRQSAAIQEQRVILIELKERTARMEATLNAIAHK